MFRFTVFVLLMAATLTAGLVFDTPASKTPPIYSEASVYWVTQQVNQDDTVIKSGQLPQNAAIIGDGFWQSENGLVSYFAADRGVTSRAMERLDPMALERMDTEWIRLISSPRILVKQNNYFSFVSGIEEGAVSHPALKKGFTGFRWQARPSMQKGGMIEVKDFSIEVQVPGEERVIRRQLMQADLRMQPEKVYTLFLPVEDKGAYIVRFEVGMVK